MKTTTKKKNTITVRRLDDLIRKVRSSAAMLVEAGEALVAVLKEDPQAIDALVDRAPDIPKGFWLNLEKVGLGQIIPELLYREGDQWRRLEKLPVREQKKAVSEGVEIYVPGSNGRGALDKKLVPVSALGRDEARMAIGSDGLRKVEEQKRFMEQLAERKAREEKATRKATAKGRDVVIGKGYVEIPPHEQPMKLTQAQVLQWIAQMQR